jgi:mRNA-degrading endonuclease RelE of RelBE toxin-antitoxin system
MASYSVRIVTSAEAEFLAVPFPFRRQINQRIHSLKNNPHPVWAQPDAPPGYFTIHVHGWRVQYSVDEDALTVTIRRIAR